MISKLFNAFLFVGSAILLLTLAGCMSSTSQQAKVNFASLDQIKGFPLTHQQDAYKIGVGDELELKFFAVPELNDRVTVSPDGTISIMFAPFTQAAGLTVNELMDEIKLLMEPHIKQLDMVIVVRNFASQKAYVTGEVQKPGPVALSGMETVMQVLGNAGWITPMAGTDKIILLRRGEDNKEHAYPIHLDKVMDSTDMSQNVVVLAGDILMVPPSDAVEADRWVDQYIRQILPFSPSAGVMYNLGNGTINP